MSFHDYFRGSSVLPDAMVICLGRGCVCLDGPSGCQAKPGPYVMSLTGQRPGGEEGSALDRHPKTVKSDSKTWVEASPENRGGYLPSMPPCVSAADRTFLTQVTRVAKWEEGASLTAVQVLDSSCNVASLSQQVEQVTQARVLAVLMDWPRCAALTSASPWLS